MKRESAATRLRQARLDAGLALSDVERRTRISPTMLRWIDEGHYDRLPAGIYARAYVRAFAEAVGLDPAEVVSSLEHALPAVDAPVSHEALDPAAASRRRTIIRRVTAAESPWPCVLAAAIDAIALLAVCGGVVAATAAVCGRPASDIVAFGLPGLLVLLAVLTALYFGIFAGVQGRTPGARACGLPPLETATPLHLESVTRRALRAFLTEASLGVELASRRSPSRQLQTTSPYGSSSTP